MREQIIILDEVDSTNIYAKSRMTELADCTVIRANRQTAGRGRLNRKWVDLGDGNLFMSFVLKPSDTFCEVYSNLTQYLSVVLCKVLEDYGITTQIKWPNDVLVDGKKIAGILSETVMQGSLFKGLALGIGVNLNASQNNVELIPDKAVTALNLEINKQVDINEFFNKLVNKFFENYEEFLKKGFELIKSEYISRAAFLDSEICVRVLNDTKHGFAKSVNDSGELVLVDNGKEFVLNIGDILC